MMVVISQPRYLPALNYLQRLFFAEIFVVLDIVQRQARGWENRNKLLLPTPTWLTIPVASSSRSLIMESKVDGQVWIEEHKNKIVQNYKTAPHFSESLLNSALILHERSNSYSDILVELLRNACRILSFEPKITLASDVLDPFEVVGVDVLISLCERIGADCYVSGPNGRNYGVIEKFSGTKIDVLFHDFSHPIYRQAKNIKFEPYMGYLDALFYCGVDWLSEFVRLPPFTKKKSK